MAQLGGNFDATGVKPKEDFEILPPGEYPVMITQSEMRPTKANDGQYLWLEMDVVSGPAQGRKLWDRLNLVNKNPKAAEIAERTLSAICHAVGVLNVSDSEQLHNRTMLAVVKVRPAEGANGPQNEVSTYRPMSGAAPAVNQQAANPTPASTPAPHVAAAASAPKAAGSVPPWRK